LYFVNKDYKESINKVIKKLKTKTLKKAITVLKGLGGYDYSVMIDGVQAYLINELSLFKNKLVSKSEYKEISNVATQQS
jgi:hypothetical protein